MFERNKATSCYRVILGKKNMYADKARRGNFIGVSFIDLDLTDHLSSGRHGFNQKLVPIIREQNPGKTKIAAGLACGALWTFAKGIKAGDVILCPAGGGNYLVGEVKGDYEFHSGQSLPHRRAVSWHREVISRDKMPESLRSSLLSIGTVSNVTKHRDDIYRLLPGGLPAAHTTDESIGDAGAFELEKHLEAFLVKNWQSTDLGRDYDIYTEDGKVGQQYLTDTGPLDILAVSKDNKALLVIELKRGRTSDAAVGQCMRYMGYVKDELAEEDQDVRGAIIGREGDDKIRRALSVAQNIDFYTYKIDFRLEKRR